VIDDLAVGVGPNCFIDRPLVIIIITCYLNDLPSISQIGSKSDPNLFFFGRDLSTGGRHLAVPISCCVTLGGKHRAPPSKKKKDDRIRSEKGNIA
jgi:hypothetical protein